MSTFADVIVHRQRVGTVVLDDGERYAQFQYDPQFVESGVQVAPLMMPLSGEVFSFPRLSAGTFQGLPGMLADALPDKFGNTLIDAWLAQQGRTPESFNAVERLCYMGARGIGALEFNPSVGPASPAAEDLDVTRLTELAAEAVSSRGTLADSLAPGQRAQALQQILSVGTSAGGARAKAVVAWNQETGEVRSGQLTAPEGFGQWILKFDGIHDNGDKELTDPAGFTVIEYAYHLMARDAGVTMSECELLTDGPRRHFMTRRFDREGSRKLHMQSLCGLAHMDFNVAGAYSYEQAMLVIRQLGLDHTTTAQMFRRAVFNIVARNQDDHTKNTAFLMDENGQWSLSPAFDVTYAYQPDGAWTGQHQMSLNGKRDGFELADFVAAGESALLKRGEARRTLEQVTAVVARWPEYAQAAGVPEAQMEGVRRTLRLNLVSAGG